MTTRTIIIPILVIIIIAALVYTTDQYAMHDQLEDTLQDNAPTVTANSVNTATQTEAPEQHAPDKQDNGEHPSLYARSSGMGMGKLKVLSDRGTQENGSINGAIMESLVIMSNISKTIILKDTWITIKSVSISLDKNSSTLNMSASIITPSPCWKAKPSFTIVNSTGVIAISIERPAMSVCVQTISEYRVTAATQSNTIPEKLIIIVATSGEEHTIELTP